MNYWLIKSEPNVYGYDTLLSAGKGTWDGVRNYQARNNLKEMKMNDLLLFYHSNIGKEVVGIAKVTREFYQDPTTKNTNWVAIDLVPIQQLDKPVSLATIKSHPDLHKTMLVKHSRLSVMPLKKEEFDLIIAMGTNI